MGQGGERGRSMGRITIGGHEGRPFLITDDRYQDRPESNPVLNAVRFGGMEAKDGLFGFGMNSKPRLRFRQWHQPCEIRSLVVIDFGGAIEAVSSSNRIECDNNVIVA